MIGGHLSLLDARLNLMPMALAHARRERKSRHQSGSRERHRSRRRRDGSESGSEDDEFGGYVPRKRQEEPRAGAGPHPPRC